MKKKKKLLLGLSASPRGRLSSEGYLEALDKVANYQEMYELIYELTGEKKISNTEALLLASLFGARSKDIEIDVINLKEVFQSKKISVEELLKKVEACSGIIIGTPVYFGDRSCWFDLFIEQLREHNINVQDKIFGAVSVGAKRNGGQETTLIFGLLDALNLGFNVVGNGPPTSQFGGTGWAGDIGKIQDDNFGLDTALGLGNRVKRYFEILSTQGTSCNELNIGILHSGFGKDDKEVTNVAKKIKEKGAKVEVINVDALEISPCLGCSVCPKEPGLEYGCRITDGMKSAKDLASSIDGLIFMLRKTPKNKTNYQMFLERTRFIRRDNFIMSDLPFGAYYFEDTFFSSQYATRMFMSFLRHNMYIVSPLVQFINSDENMISNTDPDKMFSRLFFFASKSAAARKKGNIKYSYKAIGYGSNT